MMLETKWVDQSVQYVIWELVFGVALYLGITSPWCQMHLLNFQNELAKKLQADNTNFRQSINVLSHL